MISPDTKYVPHPDVVHTALENGEAVLLHLGTNQYFSLNDTGARIWELIDKGLTLEEIGQEIEAMYDLTLDWAQQYVSNLADELISEKLLQLSDN